MLHRDAMLALLERALRYSSADQTEVVLSSSTRGLTRLANGGIHQHVAVSDTTARVRAALGQRIGVATSNTLDDDGLRTVVERAIAIARVSEPNPDFTTLPASPPAVPATDWDDAMIDTLSPERRAAMAAILTETAAGNNITAAGHIATSLSALAVGNSLGTRAYHHWTDCGVMAIMTRDAASGYAAWDGALPDDAPVAHIAGIASGKCLAGEHPVSVTPGPYTVILEAPAVAEMLVMLAFIGLGATALLEGRSCLSERIGETLVGENITLRDDTYYPGMITLPFDFEGVPRQVVPFFDRGVARGVVYDSLTAHRAGTGYASTGHALPAPSPEGPFPLHLVLEPGTASREQMIAGVERGILVTRFHYVNIVHPKETILTGMTRDGAFLIEHGAISRPVHNLRFTQSILSALSHVTALENRLALVNQENLYCLAPALRIEEFNFTS